MGPAVGVMAVDDCFATDALTLTLRRLLLALAVLTTTLAGSATVGAHSGIQSYVYVSVFDTGVEGRVEYPIGDLAAALDIELPEARNAAFALMRERTDDVVAYTSENLAMSDGDGEWPIRFLGRIDRLDVGQSDYVQVPFVVDRDFADAPRTWSATFTGVIEDNPERDALFLIEDDWGSGIFDNEADHLLGFSVGNETQQIAVEDVSAVSSMWEIAVRGWKAIDRSQIQVLVLLAVALAAVVRQTERRWQNDLRHIASRVGAVIVGQIAVLFVMGIVGTELTTRLGLAVASLGGLLALLSSRLSGTRALTACVGAGLLAGVAIGSRFVFLQLDQSRLVLSLLAFALGLAAAAACLAALYAPLALLLTRLSRTGLIADIIAGIAVAIGAIGIVDRALSLGLSVEKWGVTIANVLTNPIFAACATALVAWVALREVGASKGADPSESHETERIEI